MHLIRLLLASALICALGAESKVLKVVSESWEGATNEDGTGVYFDVVRAVFESEGYTVEFKTMPYARAVSEVEAGKAHLWLGSYEDEVEGINFPKQEMDIDSVVAVHAKDKAFSGAADLAKASGVKVAWVRDYGLDGYIDVEMDFKEVNGHDQGLKMVAAGRIDYFLDAEVEAEPLIEELKLGDKVAMTHLIDLKLLPGFVKGPEGAALVEIWDRRMPQLHAEGVLKPIYDKYDYAVYPFK
ncbi:MAG: transporter substrate-binding domain-containing protein [Planctomycetota bacterium]|jgi:polar amino acid transport system substrate-binding protein|nr:transporter substrate-binding domain-containing protein [Planctomycetota bacterium]